MRPVVVMVLRRRLAALQTATAQISIWPVTCGDGRGLDRRLCFIPQMAHTLRIWTRKPYCRCRLWVSADVSAFPAGRELGQADQRVKPEVLKQEGFEFAAGDQIHPAGAGGEVMAGLAEP